MERDMKRRIIQYTTVVLAFLAGMIFMTYMTRMGNRDMTGDMAQAQLPVVHAEQDGVLYNEMHGYVEDMDGASMRDSVIGVSEDHKVGLALEKYNAQIKSVSYEVRRLDMSRLIEGGDDLQAEDDGKYLHISLTLKDLLTQGEEYLLVLKVQTEDQDLVRFYSILTYLGTNHVQDCVDFAQRFHEMTLTGDSDGVLNYLEQDGSMDGKNLGYINIHSRSGPVTWGDMQVEQIGDPSLRFTELESDITALTMEYQVTNTEINEQYQVREAYRLRYTSTRIYLLAYERWTDKILEPGRQLVEDGKLAFGIQSSEPVYMKNTEENVVGFIEQGQLWSYDYGQNRLSLVYGFMDGQDGRADWKEHDLRLLKVDDTGSMDFLLYGYMNRGRYEGRSGVMFCHYDALMNTVEELFFVPSDQSYMAMKEDIGDLAVQNGNGKAWLCWQGNLLQINLDDHSVTILARNVNASDLQVSDSGLLAAWNDEDSGDICLLNTSTGVVSRIEAGDGEVLKTLGFMEEDLIYGAGYSSDIYTDQAGKEMQPLYCVTIRDQAGKDVRQFEYSSKGKYVSGVTIVENRIDLACVAKASDGSWQEALSEPITYTSETHTNLLKLSTVYDEVRRNEYVLTYGGNIRKGSMKQPNVRLVLYEGSRIVDAGDASVKQYLAYRYDGSAEGFETLTEAVQYAYNGMGSVWYSADQCYWCRGGRKSQVQLNGYDDSSLLAGDGSDLAQCVQLLLKQKQIYTDVQTELDQGTAIWQILTQELGEDACLLPGCSLSMALYYVSQGSPVVALIPGGAVLIVGYDAQNIIYYRPGSNDLTKGGMNDSSSMFEEAGNVFYTCLP